MDKRYYTLDDLLTFCKTNNFNYFNAKEYGAPLVIQSFETFELEEDDSHKGLLPVKLAACHIGRNRNGSAISEDTMKEYMDSFKGRPILGSIIQLDSGEYDFHSHDMELIETEDGIEVDYIEIPVGIVSQLDDPYLEYDKEMDKTYLIVKGHIFEDYSRASEILQRKKKCKCSVEIAVEEMSFNAKENYLSIDKFYFTGVTILGSEPDGTEIAEGMAGSNITIDSFSKNGNFVFKSEENYQNLLIDTLEKLNNTLSAFQINNIEEGVESEMSHFEELLIQYGFTVEEIDFEYENMTDEELNAAFENFKCKNEECDETFDEDEPTTDIDNTDTPATEGNEASEPQDNEGGEDDEGSESTEDEAPEDDNVSDKKRRNEEVFVKTFKVEVSHEDISNALYRLLGEYDELDNDWYYIRNVYDNHFLMQAWCSGKLYKQGYKVDEEGNVSFEGERQEMFELIVSESEKIAIDKMREDYAALKQFKEDFEAAENKAAKDAIFANDIYNDIRESDEFKALVANADKYSVEELQDKCDLLFAANAKQARFSLVFNETPHALGVNLKKSNKKTQAYSGLFDE